MLFKYLFSLSLFYTYSKLGIPTKKSFWLKFQIGYLRSPLESFANSSSSPSIRRSTAPQIGNILGSTKTPDLFRLARGPNQPIMKLPSSIVGSNNVWSNRPMVGLIPPPRPLLSLQQQQQPQRLLNLPRPQIDARRFL